MKIDVHNFRVVPGSEVRLAAWPTEVKPAYKTKAQYRDFLERHIANLSSLQQLLYASNDRALLVIFQGMDTAGKDGAIKHVMSGVNPQGCQVFSFKHPSAEELEHDFLWRTTRHLPERGRIGIFNRSYYEEVLITRVHPEILRAEGLSGPGVDLSQVWLERYRSITDLERHLNRNGTRVVKIFLHVSKDEQRRRLIRRIDDTDKNWKFSRDDVEERKYWDMYIAAYEQCIAATSTDEAPWHIVPADDKDNARLIVSQVLLDELVGMDLNYPETTVARQRELQHLRAELASE